MTKNLTWAVWRPTALVRISGRAHSYKSMKTCTEVTAFAWRSSPSLVRTGLAYPRVWSATARLFCSSLSSSTSGAYDWRRRTRTRPNSLEKSSQKYTSESTCRFGELDTCPTPQITKSTKRLIPCPTSSAKLTWSRSWIRQEYAAPLGGSWSHAQTIPMTTRMSQPQLARNGSKASPPPENSLFKSTRCLAVLWVAHAFEPLGSTSTRWTRVISRISAFENRFRKTTRNTWSSGRGTNDSRGSTSACKTPKLSISRTRLKRLLFITWLRNRKRRNANKLFCRRSTSTRKREPTATMPRALADRKIQSKDQTRRNHPPRK